MKTIGIALGLAMAVGTVYAQAKPTTPPPNPPAPVSQSAPPAAPAPDQVGTMKLEVKLIPKIAKEQAKISSLQQKLQVVQLKMQIVQRQVQAEIAEQKQKDQQ